jgi:hypothetical protein
MCFVIFLVFSSTSVEVFGSPDIVDPNDIDDSICPGLQMVLSEDRCVDKCGDGTEWDGVSECKISTTISESGLIIWGIVIAVIATVIGIAFSVWDKMRERTKRTQELIQLYDEELRTIVEEEKDLKTKLECVLYAERFLDTLEKIATLSNSKNFGGSVSNFFENNFSYGIDLWRWYHKNVIKVNIDLIEDGDEVGALWGLPLSTDEINENNVNDVIESFKNAVIKRRKSLQSINKSESFTELNDESLKELLFKYLKDERWNEFRTWCKSQTPPITALQSDFGEIQQSNVSENEKYRILPDSLYDSFALLPEENGLSKGEFVEIVRNFGNDLSNISKLENNLNTKLDCSIYAEQYLDLLEQIASLYKADIIPKKAADYFENKFSMGRNLWDWYQKFVNTKISKGENKSKSTDGEFRSPEEIALFWNVDVSDDLKALTDLTDEEHSEIKNFLKNERWREFKWWCKYGKDGKNKITPFDDDYVVDDEGVNVGSILPNSMYYYEKLPDDDGIDAEKLLDIITNYGKQLTRLVDKERNLKTKLDCTVYVEQYLDTLEQIAYLFNSKALAADIPTYFENNFSYGLTMLTWYREKLGTTEDESGERWSDFLKYTDEWEKVGPDEFKALTPFDQSKLPDIMIKYFDLLHEDIPETSDEIARRLEKEKSDNN